MKGEYKMENKGKTTDESCDVNSQKEITEKMSDCDKNSKSYKDKHECYTKVVEENGKCMSS